MRNRTLSLLAVGAALALAGCASYTGNGHYGGGYQGGGGIHPSDQNPGYYAGQFTNKFRQQHPSYSDPNWFNKNNPNGYWARQGHGVRGGGHGHPHGHVSGSISVITRHLAGRISGSW